MYTKFIKIEFQSKCITTKQKRKEKNTSNEQTNTKERIETVNCITIDVAFSLTFNRI